MSYSLKIAHIYPDLLNMYGDKGNIATLKNRLLWRNIDCSITEIRSGEDFSTSDFDIILLGGGGDKAEASALENLINFKDAIKTYIEDGGVFLAVCGGYPMLGKYVSENGKKEECLGVLDIYTENHKTRFTGNTVLFTDFCETVVGFENHFGKTFTGEYTPLGKKASGESEGIIYKNLFATYLHGPLLPKNPRLADELLCRALKKKYGENILLSPLDDTLENAAHNYLLK